MALRVSFLIFLGVRVLRPLLGACPLNTYRPKFDELCGSEAIGIHPVDDVAYAI